jgi:pilus assembly protein CpaE
MASNARSGAIVLFEIDTMPIEMACDCVEEICRNGAEGILLGAQTDIQIYRSLRRAGASAYFSFPTNADDILATQHPAPARQNTVVQMPVLPAKAPSIAVVGCRGGVGASLLAQNLAYHAASTRGAKMSVCLLDADLHFGTQAIDLDRDETVGLFEALMAPDRVDATFINATVDHVTDTLALYSHQVGAGQDAASYEAGFSRLFPPLRAQFEALITDLPRSLVFQRSDLARHLDAVVVVIPAGFAGVNAASRLIKPVTHPAP